MCRITPPALGQSSFLKCHHCLHATMPATPAAIAYPTQISRQGGMNYKLTGFCIVSISVQHHIATKSSMRHRMLCQGINQASALL